jgi:enoyl-[acyl-carrier-protein] reductase (NADH)
VRPRLPVWILLFCVSALPVSSLPGFVQNQTTPQSHRQDVIAPIANEDEARNRIANEMAKKAAKERVAALKHDTDKLLKLSQELKESVDKSDENVLSVDVIKKAEEIEKLAKSVKEKMKGPN